MFYEIPQLSILQFKISNFDIDKDVEPHNIVPTTPTTLTHRH